MPLPLYSMKWSSPVLMTWYILYRERDVLSGSIASLLVKFEVFDLYCFCILWCPSSSIGDESGHCIAIGTFGIHRVSSVSGDSASYGYLVISAKYFALTLLETMWCRAELSALHRASFQDRAFELNRPHSSKKKLSIVLRDAGTLFWLKEMVLENVHEVEEVLWTRTLYKAFVIIYFVLDSSWV